GQSREDLQKLFGAAKAPGNLCDNLIMNVKDDGIAGCLEPLHGGGKHVAGDRRDGIFGPETAVGALPEVAINPLPVLIVFIDDGALAARCCDKAREGISELPSAWQAHLQKIAVTLEGDALVASDDFAGVLDGFYRGLVYSVPEACCCRMRL